MRTRSLYKAEPVLIEPSILGRISLSRPGYASTKSRGSAILYLWWNIVVLHARNAKHSSHEPQARYLNTRTVLVESWLEFSNIDGPDHQLDLINGISKWPYQISWMKHRSNSTFLYFHPSSLPPHALQSVTTVSSCRWPLNLTQLMTQPRLQKAKVM